MVMPAFRHYTDASGKKQPLEEITPDVTAILQKRGFAGVIFFAQNAGETAKTVRLVDAMQSASGSVEGRPQLLTAIDQEGGLVTRLGQGTQGPGNMALGAVGDVSATKEMAGIIGQELAAIGINFNFAPVADVNSNPANPVIGTRSFSDDPQAAAEHCVAFMEGLRETGTISTLKHFPGHGDTRADTHLGFASTAKSWAEIDACEMIPFRAGIAAGAPLVMAAHVAAPAVTGSDAPSTLSAAILTDRLRGELGFTGAVVTDALEMGAIRQRYGSAEAAVAALQAGADLLLCPLDYCAAFDGVVDAVRGGILTEARIDESLRRISSLRL
jgi:beta-N-acetylhexosaminidase